MTVSGALILAIDPGREKCGVALLTGRSTLEHRVLPAGELVGYVAGILGRQVPEAIVIGNRTGAAEVRELLGRSFPGLRLVAMDEEGTTLEARHLYFADHPPQGWRRLVPRSLLVPPEPYDDYAAVALGRRYLTRTGSGERAGAS